MARNATKEELDAIRLLKPQEDCKPGEVNCPFYSRMSSSMKFCGKNGKDCPCNGLISTGFMEAPDYRAALIRIINGWNDENQKDLKPALAHAAQLLGMELTIHL